MTSHKTFHAMTVMDAIANKISFFPYQEAAHTDSYWPSTYSMTMQRWRRVSNEQNMETTNGFSAKVRMSLSTKACWIWFLRIRFCLLIFFMANRCRVSRWRTRYTALTDKGAHECTDYFFTSRPVHCLWKIFCARAWLWRYKYKSHPEEDVLMLYPPVCSITDQLDGLEVCFSWWFHGSHLPLRIKDHSEKWNSCQINNIISKQVSTESLWFSYIHIQIIYTNKDKAASVLVCTSLPWF